MLPAAHRMRRSREFSHVVRHGRRSARSTVVLHVADGETAQPTRVGLIVSKQVGGSVLRHLVARRLRATLAELIRQRPVGELIVVRALPGSAAAPSSALRTDLERAWTRLFRSEAP